MELRTITTDKAWSHFADDRSAQKQFLEILPPIVQRARWFGGKSREIKSLKCDHCLPLTYHNSFFYFFILEVHYIGFEKEYYAVPLARTTSADFAYAQWHDGDGSFYLGDATHDVDFQKCLFLFVSAGKTVSTTEGRFAFERGKALPADEQYESSRNPMLDQSNSSIFFNDRFFMKIYRKLFSETNPEVDMLRFLTEKGNYGHIPAYAGALVWERDGAAPVTLGLMMEKVDARKDSWSTTGDELNDFLASFLKGDFSIHEFVFEHVELLARRTAEMHLALAVDTDNAEFATEPYTDEYRNWLLKHLENLVKVRMKMIELNKHRLDEDDLKMVAFFQQKQKLVLSFFKQIKKKKLLSLRTRIHGDYHLGQLLHTGVDYVVIDFEGEPESSITDRKIKHSPMKDVAGMIRSFHYAVSAKLYYSNETKHTDIQRLQRSSDRWFYLIRDTFFEAYTERIGRDNPLFHSKSETNFLLLLHLLEKAIYELGYELNGRPDWVKIPLKGIVHVIHELEKYQE